MLPVNNLITAPSRGSNLVTAPLRGGNIDSPPPIARSCDRSRNVIQPQQLSTPRRLGGIGHARKHQQPLLRKEHRLQAMRAIGKLHESGHKPDHRHALFRRQRLEDHLLTRREECREVGIALFKRATPAHLDHLWQLRLRHLLRNAKRYEIIALQQIKIADRPPKIIAARFRQGKRLHHMHQRLVAMHQPPFERIVADVGIDGAIHPLRGADQIVVALFPDARRTPGNVVVGELLETPDECTDLLHGIGMASRPGKAKMHMIRHDHPCAKRNEPDEMGDSLHKRALRDFARLGKRHTLVIHAAKQRAALFETNRHEHRSPARIVIAAESTARLVHQSETRLNTYGVRVCLITPTPGIWLLHLNVPSDS